MSPLSPEPLRSSSTACFSVTARAEPGVLPRMLDLFAKRGLVPSALHATADDRDAGRMTVDIQMSGMDGQLAGYLARCLDRIYEVERVLVSEKRGAEAARVA